MHTGRCLCESVRYAIRGPLRPIIACHCSQCRRASGHFVAATSAPSANLSLISSEGLTWYRSSPQAERGFCSRCGSNLFWRRIGGDATSVMAGSLDPPTGLAIEKHIFVGGKSDYYTLDDHKPQLHDW